MTHQIPSKPRAKTLRGAHSTKMRGEARKRQILKQETQHSESPESWCRENP